MRTFCGEQCGCGGPSKPATPVSQPIPKPLGTIPNQIFGPVA